MKPRALWCTFPDLSMTSALRASPENTQLLRSIHAFILLYTLPPRPGVGRWHTGFIITSNIFSMFKKIAFASAGLLLLASPLLASAQSTNDLQAQVQALLAQLTRLQAQLASQTGQQPTTLSVPSIPTPSSTSGRCTQITRFLTIGSSGPDVKELQGFLVARGYLASDASSGYFGSLTQAALRSWQAANGVVSSGNPSSTGYGATGPKTRGALALACATPVSPRMPANSTCPLMPVVSCAPGYYPTGGGTDSNGCERPTRCVATTPNAGITVTAPNGGEQWEIGQLNTVTWAPYGYNPDVNPARDVNVFLERLDGSTVGQVMDTGKASLHTYFNIGGYDNWAEPGRYYVRASNRVTGATDRSDAPFTLLTRPTADLKVNGSDGPMVLTHNQPITISWSSLAGSTCNIHGVQESPDAPYAYITGVPASGTRSVYAYVYTSIPEYKNFILLRCSRGGTFADDEIIINPSTSQARLQVVSPNGGEQLTLNGQTSVINYRASGIKSVSIALYKSDQWMKWLAKDQVPTAAAQSGDVYQFTWTPTTAELGAVNELGNTFKVYVTGQKADGTGYVDDKSDLPFSFVALPTPTSGLVIGLTPQPSSTIAPQATIVPLTKFTLRNSGGTSIQLQRVKIQQTGLGTDGAVHHVVITSENGSTNSSPAGFDADHLLSMPLPDAWISAGETKTYTLSAAMQANLASYAGGTIALRLLGIVTPSRVSGQLPIDGSTATVNVSLDVCSNQSLYGYRCWTTPIPVSQMPIQPPMKDALCSPDGTRATLSWGGVPNATSYPVRVDDPALTCTGPLMSSLGNAGCVSPTEYVNDGLTGTSVSVSITPNTMYEWWVHGLNASGWSSVTRKSFICRQSTPTPVPSITVTNTTRPNITFTYQNLPPGVQGVFLTNNNTETNVASAPIASGSGSGGISMPSVSPAGTYYLKVLATVNNALIAMSQPFTIGPEMPQLTPPQPSALSAACNGGTSVTLSWTRGPGAVYSFPRIAASAQTSQSACPSGYSWASPTSCYQDNVTTNSITYPVQAGTIYSWWVHNSATSPNSAWSNVSPQTSGSSFTCSTPAAQSCTFNGQTIASGSSVTAYQASSVAAGQTCAAQTRTCQNGSLSGSYTNASCTVQSGSSVPSTVNAFWTSMYSCVLGRAADTAGLNYWVGQTNSVGSLLTAYRNFYDSAEYRARGTSDTDYVNSLYQCVLFRAPDSGPNYWVGQLQGGASRDSVLQNFINSAEFQGTQGPTLRSATGLTIASANTQMLSQLASALNAIIAILNSLK